jgi:hypothetical protein
MALHTPTASHPAQPDPVGARSERVVELKSIAAVGTRYDLAGPHTTAIVPVAVPGTVGDDFTVRWSATRADLAHLGASEPALARLDDVVSSVHRGGHTLLLTANDETAAFCWLSFDIEPLLQVAPLPALVPAIREISASSTIVVAAVDRVGADIFEVGQFDITPIHTVEGEHEQIHKAASGGWSQPRHQRHSEVTWERNATLIATELARVADRARATTVLVTGDDRAVHLVEDHLEGQSRHRVAQCHAGGRHEPETPTRLLDAARAERWADAAAVCERQLDDLREELGQHDRAIAGSVEVLEAITENRVGTLFVDIDEGRAVHHVDAIVRAALAHGAQLVVGAGFEVDDGLAALLRAAYA